MTRPRTFRLHREVDVTGTSGTGDVAWGVLWPDGTCALRWNTKYASSVVYESLEHVEVIHLHHGQTSIVWDPEVAEAAPVLMLELNCGCSAYAEISGLLRAARFKVGDSIDCALHGKSRLTDFRVERVG